MSAPPTRAPLTPVPKLELKGVAKTFQGRRILDDVDIAVERGRSLVIIGASGQGKSVTLKIAVGLLRPDKGRIYMDGEDMTELRTTERSRMHGRLGVLFQGAALFDSLKVWQNVGFRLTNADKVPRKEARERAIEALARVGLPRDVADRYPAEISGGMQKRVGLARAVVAHPDILFFDEPTTGLDPITSDTINNLILEEVKRLGCTAVSITHDIASARKIGDEIAMLHGGRIVWRGPAKTIDEADSPYVQQFINGRAHGPITCDA